MKYICQKSDTLFSQLTKVAEYFPDAIKLAETAVLDDADYFENLSDNSFALPETRQFPINNKEQTILSLGYSKIAADKVPKQVVDTLTKAAFIYDIDVDALFPPIEKAIVEQEKVAYLLPDIQRFRVSSEEDIPLVEKAFLEKYAQMSVPQRVEAGSNLIKLAEEYSVELSPGTQKLSGFTITSTKVMKDWVDARTVAADKLGSDISQAYVKLAQSIDNLPPYIKNKDEQLEMIDMFIDMDKQAGVDAFYNKGIPDPFRTVFNTDLDSNDFVKIGSVLANKELLSSLPLSFWEDILGEAGVSEIAPGGVINPDLLSTVVDTLPADLKNIIETQLASYNN